MRSKVPGCLNRIVALIFSPIRLNQGSASGHGVQARVREAKSGHVEPTCFLPGFKRRNTIRRGCFGGWACLAPLIKLMRTQRPYLLVGLAFFLFSGCAALTKAATKNAAKGVTEGVVDATLKDESFRQILKTVTEDPEIQKIASTVVHSLLQDAAEGLSDGLKAKVPALTDALLSALLQAWRQQGGAFVKELQPQVEFALKHLLEESILAAGRALRMSVQKDLSVATRILVQTATKTFVVTLLQSLQGMDGKIEPFVAQNITPALGKLSHEVSKEAILGVQEALRQGDVFSPAKIQEMAFFLGKGLGQGLVQSVVKDPVKPVLIVVASILGGLLIIQVILFWWLFRRYQKSVKGLVLMTSQINQAIAQGEPIQKLWNRIRKAYVTANHNEWLGGFLRDKGLGSELEDPPTS